MIINFVARGKARDCRPCVAHGKSYSTGAVERSRSSEWWEATGTECEESKLEAMMLRNDVSCKNNKGFVQRRPRQKWTALVKCEIKKKKKA